MNRLEHEAKEMKQQAKQDKVPLYLIKKRRELSAFEKRVRKCKVMSARVHSKIGFYDVPNLIWIKMNRKYFSLIRKKRQRQRRKKYIHV